MVFDFNREIKFRRLTEIDLFFSKRKTLIQRSIVLAQCGVGLWEPDEIFPRVPIFSEVALITFMCILKVELNVEMVDKSL